MGCHITTGGRIQVMKIILADDHALFRKGMQLMLAALSDQTSVLEADCHDALLELLAANPDADLALVDLHMPGRANDLDGLAEVLSHAQTVPVVVLSASDRPEDMQQAIKAGAMGFIPKYERADVMLCALQLVLNGGVYIPPALMAHPAGHAQARLTPKQLEVLEKMCKGYSNKEISRSLNISEATVKCHTTAIFRELDVGSRTQAVAAAKQQGLVG
jgi:DNA-binding NarL/FixJ family response regulator